MAATISNPQRIQIGSGRVYFSPLTTGNPATPSTARQVAEMQDFSLDIAGTIKELRSNQQFPDDTAVVDKKITWKLTAGIFDNDLYNNLFGGETAATGAGQGVPVTQESGTIPSTNPYTVTVSGAAQWVQTLSVNYSATGQPLTKVTSSPASTQFSVSAGVYTFAAADAGLGVLISYLKTLTTGCIVTTSNHIIGYSPIFEIFAAQEYNELTSNVPNYIHLYSAKCNKFSFPFKRADYLIVDIEGEAFANSAGKVFDIYSD